MEVKSLLLVLLAAGVHSYTVYNYEDVCGKTLTITKDQPNGVVLLDNKTLNRSCNLDLVVENTELILGIAFKGVDIPDCKKAHLQIFGFDTLADVGIDSQNREILFGTSPHFCGKKISNSPHTVINDGYVNQRIRFVFQPLGDTDGDRVSFEFYYTAFGLKYLPQWPKVTTTTTTNIPTSSLPENPITTSTRSITSTEEMTSSQSTEASSTEMAKQTSTAKEVSPKDITTRAIFIPTSRPSAESTSGANQQFSKGTTTGGIKQSSTVSENKSSSPSIGSETSTTSTSTSVESISTGHSGSPVDETTVDSIMTKTSSGQITTPFLTTIKTLIALSSDVPITTVSTVDNTEPPSRSEELTTTETYTPKPTATDTATPKLSTTKTATPPTAESTTPKPTTTEAATPKPTTTESTTPKPTTTESTTPKPTTTESTTPKPTTTEATTPKPTTTESTTPKPTTTESTTPRPTTTESTTPKPTTTESFTPKPTTTETSTPKSTTTESTTPKPTTTESTTPKPTTTETSTPKSTTTESTTPKPTTTESTTPKPTTTESTTPKPTTTETSTPKPATTVMTKATTSKPPIVKYPIRSHSCKCQILVERYGKVEEEKKIDLSYVTYSFVRGTIRDSNCVDQYRCSKVCRDYMDKNLADGLETLRTKFGSETAGDYVCTSVNKAILSSKPARASVVASIRGCPGERHVTTLEYRLCCVGRIHSYKQVDCSRAIANKDVVG